MSYFIFLIAAYVTKCVASKQVKGWLQSLLLFAAKIVHSSTWAGNSADFSNESVYNQITTSSWCRGPDMNSSDVLQELCYLVLDVVPTSRLLACSISTFESLEKRNQIMKFTNKKGFNSYAQEHWTQLRANLRLPIFIWQTLTEPWTSWVLNFLVD